MKPFGFNRSSCSKPAFRRRGPLLLAIVLLSACPFGCVNRSSSAGAVQQDKFDQAILERVRTFATDEGSLGKEAWVALTANNPQDLVNSLNRLLRSKSIDELDKMFVAFTLWNLDVDYQENRKLIVADFNESLKNADSLERLISRLVDRGDADLLVHLLAVSLRADGGLTEGLAGTFAKQMETQPVRFLTLLIEQPAEVRSRTYHLVEMGSSDTERLKTFLAGVPKNSRVWLVAREMLEAISKS